MTYKTQHRQDLLKKLPIEVKQIFDVFLQENKNFQDDAIRLVGGSVRDMILNYEVKDFDFATKFLPEQAIKILHKANIQALETGVKFGTITAVINKKHFEITTLRQEENHDGRHFEAKFVDDYFFDAARRDFSINALYLDNKGVVHDYFNGIDDLINKKVKFIGDANKRIVEDYLRILRFFRFSLRYASSLDIEGLKACVDHKKNLKNLSQDRIRNEIAKMLEDENKDAVIKIFDEIENYKIREELFAAKLKTVNLKKLFNAEEVFKINASWQLKLFSLIFAQDLNLQEIFTNLNFSNHKKSYFKFLFDNMKNVKVVDNKALTRLLVFEKKDFVFEFTLFYLAQNQDLIIKDIAKNNLKFIEEFILPDFLISGQDLISLGFEGKKIGEILAKLKDIWIENNFKITREEILEKAKNL